METFANIAPIIRKGGKWFASIGTEKSKGTKVFALAGRVNNTGLIEVPMGTLLREVVFDIGGGIPDGKKFKAVQTGGPSGGCIPDQFLDMPMDYESLAKVGSIMGSGGLIVMDETSCMVDVAKFFMEFCMSESCGKCVPCRVGTTQIYNILERITQGQGTPSDIAMLEELADLVKNTSLCGLGQTSPNPTMSTLRYFLDGVHGSRGGRSVSCRSVLHTSCQGGHCMKPPQYLRGEVRTDLNPVRILTFKIDDRDVSAREDETILTVARQNGINIPTLCHLDGLSERGACRLCIVEIVGAPRLLPACVTRPRQDMEVITNSERVVDYRKKILELLFTERNHVCSVCVVNGNCELQALATELGMTHVHYEYLYPRHTIDATHDRFSVDHNRCVLCQRCVRVCDEIEGAHTWDVMGRGIMSRAITDLG